MMQQTTRMAALTLALVLSAGASTAAENDGPATDQGGGADSGSATGGDSGQGDGPPGGGGTEGGDGAGGQDIVTVLQSQGSYNQTAEAIDQAGLAETLRGQGAFTVFAPTDEAWQQLPQDERDRLMSEAGLSRLRTVISYHVVPDEIGADDIQQMGSVTTIQGQPLEVSRSGDQITVNGAAVTQPDMQAGNGIIHGIDQVLMPQQ